MPQQTTNPTLNPRPTQRTPTEHRSALQPAPQTNQTLHFNDTPQVQIDNPTITGVRADTPNNNTWLPTLRHLFMLQPPLIKHIPHQIRQEITRSFTATLWDYVRAAGEAPKRKAMTRLFLWPAAILVAIPDKQDKDRRKPDGTPMSNRMVILKRLERWRTGETKLLWEQALRQKRIHRGANRRGKSQNHRTRVINLAQEGAMAKAVRALDSNGVHTMSNAVKTSLLAKHPQTTPLNEGDCDFDAAIPFPPPPPMERITRDEVDRAIRKFPQASAGGGSKMTPAHFKQMASCPDAALEHGFLDALAAVCTTMLRGEMPTELTPWITGAPLTPLKKPDGGVRPIAVGETLRRIVSSIALSRVVQRARDHLAPFQLGVATKNGSETIIHATRKWIEKMGNNNNYAMLQLDLKNAFNLISRRVILRETRRHLPEILPWVRLCYANGDDPILWSDDFMLKSHSGIQQGDPLGPLLFAMGLQPIIRRLRGKMKAEASALGITSPNNETPFLTAFYLDDGIIIAPHRILELCATFLQSPDVKKYGLHLNSTKTTIWWPTSPADTSLLPLNLPTEWSEGTNILGSPIGSHTYQKREMEAVANRKNEILLKLRDLGDAHTTLSILRACLGASQMNYHIRTVPPGDTKNATVLYDNQIERILRSLAGGTLPKSTFQELLLPLKVESEATAHFGIGITSAYHTRNAAYLASRLATTPHIESLTNNIPPPPISCNTDAMAFIDQPARNALVNYCEQVGPDEAEKLRDTLKWESWTGPKSQRDLTQLVHNRRIALLSSTNEREERFRKSMSLPGAKDWLKARPSKSLHTHIADRDYRTWFAFYCRRPLANPGTRCPRVNCRVQLDTYGDHLLTCKYSARSTYSPLIRRHDAQVRLLHSDLKAALRNPILEPRDNTPTHRVRPDIVALGPHGEEELIDVAICHHFMDTNMRGRVQQRKQQKIKHYTQLQKDTTNSRIVPIIIPAIGGWEQDAYDYMRELADATAHRQHAPVAWARSVLFSRHASRLVASNARCLLAGAVD